MLLGRLNCNTSSAIAIHINVMQLQTAVLDKSDSHINFTCRWNKSTVAVTWNYILLYFEELPEYFRCASGKLRPQHAKEFGFVPYNYDIYYIWNLLQGPGSDAPNTVETSVHTDNRNTEFRISDTVIYVTKTPELQRRNVEKECSNILYVTNITCVHYIHVSQSILPHGTLKKLQNLLRNPYLSTIRQKFQHIYHVGYANKSTANLKLIDNLIDSPDTSIVYGELCWMTWL